MGELRKFSRNFASGFTNVELVLLRQYSGGMPGIANYCSTFSSVLPRTRYISTFAVNRQGIMAVDRPSIRAIPISLPNSKFHFSLHFSVRVSPNSDNFSFFFFVQKFLSINRSISPRREGVLSFIIATRLFYYICCYNRYKMFYVVDYSVQTRYF